MQVDPGADSEAIMSAINQSRGHLKIVPPQIKQLACGDVGMGAMGNVQTILAMVGEQLAAT